MKQVITVKAAALFDLPNQIQAGLWAFCHSNSYGAIERYHRGGLNLCERVIQPNNLRPVRIRCSKSTAMLCSDCRLKRVLPGLAPERFRNEGKGFSDLIPIPQTAILILKDDQIACRVQPRISARIVQKHQGEQSSGFGWRIRAQ
jgi:hypothetical protein